MANEALCLTICSIAVLFFVEIEVTEIYNQGRAYFTSAFNYVDMFLIFSWFLYSYTIWTKGANEFDKVTAYTDDIVKMNCLRVFIVVVSFIKIVSYCRVF
jgi:hypothetical protein